MVTISVKTTSSAVTTTPMLPPGSIAAIVVGSLFGLVLIILIVIVIICVRNRSKRRKESRFQQQTQVIENPSTAFTNPNSIQGQPPKEEPTGRREAPLQLLTLHHPSLIPRQVPIIQFKQHVESLKAHSDSNFWKQFQELKEESEVKHRLRTSNAGDTIVSRNKNRHPDAKAYDHSRVKLSLSSDNQQCDYINANFIGGFHSPKEYIACQGPLSTTVNDHWQMIFEQNVSVIVMLTQCVEKEGKREKEKCFCYWPELNETATYGDVQVTTRNSIDAALSGIYQPSPHYTIRELQVTAGECTRTITQYHCLVWKDFGSLNKTALIEFVNIIRSTLSPVHSPVVVHCSAGIGRTGAFIALDILLQEIESAPNEETKISIFNTIMDLRKCRYAMVCAEAQYIVLHECVLEAIRDKKKGKTKFYVNPNDETNDE